MGLVNGANTLPGFSWFKPCIEAKDVVYIGLRDLDIDEKETIKKLGIKSYTVSSFLVLYLHPRRWFFYFDNVFSFYDRCMM
jgi:arginase family enzyme